MLQYLKITSFLAMLSIQSDLILSASSQKLLKYGSDCITPTNETGHCVSINSCTSAFAKYENWKTGQNRGTNNVQLEELSQAQCNMKNGIPYVCCAENEIHINEKILENLSRLECGRSSTKKISNGEKANILDYRWMVLLKYEGERKFRCGGSLINDRYVLTAAHCFNGGKDMPIGVRLGEYNIDEDIDCTGFGMIRKCLPIYEDFSIQHYFIPDDYVFDGLYHDIALIRLERKVEFTRGIGTICLPITQELQRKVSDWYFVAGWGHKETGEKSSVLLYAHLPKQSLDYCRQTFSLSADFFNESHICAGGERFRDSCKGDSGGPLFRTDLYTDGVLRSIQYGIVSLGVPICGIENAPAIYTNVSYYMQWITDHMLMDI